MKEENYKGYLIKYHRTSEWFALLFRPGSSLAMAGSPHAKATLQEGEEILLMRARQKVDEEESRPGASGPGRAA